MATLFEIKDKMVSLFKKFEVFIMPAIKFIFALLVIGAVSKFMNDFDTSSKMAILDKGIIKLAMAVIVAFVPASWFVFLLMVIITGRLFFVSFEAAFIVFIVMMVLYLMFVRLFPKQAILVIVTPFMMSINLAYVIPILVGLFIGPAAIIPVAVGVIVYFLAAYMPGLLEMKSVELSDLPITLVDMYRYFMDAASHDKGMILMIGVFAAVIVATYFISRLEMEYVQYIAIGFGGLITIFGFIIGNIILGAGVKVGGVFLGAIIGVILVGIAQFFRFSLDYQKTEKHQFEDDDYYYYVKAIPKIKIAKSKKEVKTIE